MSFTNLKVDELKELAAFYAVEPEVADAEHGPTKKELLAALAADEISNEDYETFLASKKPTAEKTPEVEKTEEKPAPVEEPDEPAEPTKDEEKILIKYERANPTYQVGPYTFYKAHPFLAVPPDVAENLIRSKQGFRQALPSEVADYYN